MEAARLPTTRTAPTARLRQLASRYGLYVVLLALPVYYGIQDLADDGNLIRLGQNFVAGLSNGSIWALIAIGYTLVYGIVELINFAHGDVFMIGSFVAAGFAGTLGLTAATGTFGLVLGLLATLIVAMIASGMLNVM